MPKKIRFVLPGTAISGGVHVIFRYADWLLKEGHDVKIINLNDRRDNNWYPLESPIISVNSLNLNDLKDIDTLICTAWGAIDYVLSIPAKAKINFLQTDERRCYSDPRKSYKVHTAYTKDLEVVVNSRWQQKLWLSAFNRKSKYIPNSLDQEVFFKSQPHYPKSNKIRVLLEGNLLNPFKGMSESYDAVKDLDCEIWVVSSYGTPPKYWRVDKFFQAVPFNDLQKIYSSCDILLKMSTVEGFFLPPMEAMACGCAVVTGKVTGYDEYIVDGYNALVVNKGNISGATKAVKSLIDNKALRDVLIENGLKTVKEWPVERSKQAVLNIFSI